MPTLQDWKDVAALGETLRLGDLTGRVAKCACGKTAPSSDSLDFFGYRGEGSDDAARTCGRCGYYDTAHMTHYAPGATVPSPRFNVVERGLCVGFIARGAAPFDTFYCGHAGWD